MDLFQISLEIKVDVIRTCITGDGCSTNLKATRLLEENDGINSPMTRCTSHSSSGCIRRFCTPKTMCQLDATSLMKIYEQ